VGLPSPAAPATTILTTPCLIELQLMTPRGGGGEILSEWPSTATRPQGDLGNVRSDYVNGINADDGPLLTVRTFDQDSSLTTGPGWDDVTGVGAPTAEYIAQLIAGKH
jgi:hypothetical protein